MFKKFSVHCCCARESTTWLFFSHKLCADTPSFLQSSLYTSLNNLVSACLINFIQKHLQIHSLIYLVRIQYVFHDGERELLDRSVPLIAQSSNTKTLKWYVCSSEATSKSWVDTRISFKDLEVISLPEIIWDEWETILYEVRFFMLDAWEVHSYKRNPSLFPWPIYLRSTCYSSLTSCCSVSLCVEEYELCTRQTLRHACSMYQALQA